METSKIISSLGLTFDDVLLLPNYAGFARSEINLSANLTRNIKLSLPLVSAPMDTVTESKLAIGLARLGGIGIIHRNLTVEKQANEVSKVKETHSANSGQALLVGAAVGVSKGQPAGLRLRGRSDSRSRQGFEERVKALVSAKVDVLVIDSAHGFSKQVIDALKFIKKTFPKVQVIAGSVATFDGAKALIEAGADGLRVGMGPGAICTTRVISGMGVPQITAIFETVRAAKSKNIPIIADGGIQHSGDIVKALAAGASTVMMGSFFASTIESPGKTLELSREQVPQRFQSSLNGKTNKYLFKEYRGMGSIAAMKEGAKVKSEDEFHGKNYYKERVLVAEGVEGLVPVKGSVGDVVNQAIGGVKSGMYYVGAKTIKELWKAQFIQITQASLSENHPHDILVTNPGENYQVK